MPACIFFKKKQQQKTAGRLDFKTQLQTLREQIKKKIKASYQAYEEDQCDSKKLFSFLKSSRRHQQGTPPLKHENKLHTDTKIKADLSNQQFNCFVNKKTHFVASWYRPTVDGHLPVSDNGNDLLNSLEKFDNLFREQLIWVIIESDGGSDFDRYHE